VVATDGLDDASAFGPFDSGGRREVDVPHPASGQKFQEKEPSEHPRKTERFRP
jgi:hypothetical protein